MKRQDLLLLSQRTRPTAPQRNALCLAPRASQRANEMEHAYPSAQPFVELAGTTQRTQR